MEEEAMFADQAAAYATETERGAFIVRTYAHLTGAIFVFTGLLAAIVMSPAGLIITKALLSVSWLLVLGLFIGVSMLADYWARSDQSLTMQYIGLGLYVVAEAIIFTPLVFIAAKFQPDAIAPAAILTLVIFGGLTGYVLISKADFSWMGGMLAVASMAALGAIVCGALFGFSLGTGFSALMVALAAGYILYSTSNILHVYPTNAYVAASLALFASVALMFWYILQLFMSMDD